MKNEKEKIEPFLKYDSKLNDNSISEVDAFVYAVIAMHANNETREAYPSIRRICEITKYDKDTVMNSIDVLKSKDFFTVKQVTASIGYFRNVYYLPNLDKDFIMMSHRFIEAEDIPRDLKAFLIKIHPLLDTRIEGNRAKLIISIPELCDFFGYKERTIKNKLKRLMDLDIIEFEGMTVSKKRFNNNTNVFIFNLPAMKQEILKLKEKVFKMEIKVDDHEERIRKLEEELAAERRKRRYLEDEKRMNERVERYELSICN